MLAEASVVELDADFCRTLLPRRDPDGHKGTFGTVVCVAGSLEYAGAGILCATSAARGGAGLVALAVPHWLAPVVAGRVPEVVTVPLFGLKAVQDLDPELALASVDERSPDAVVFGPGVAETDGYHRLLEGLLSETGAPVVVDGSGLNLLARTTGWFQANRRQVVLTPHPAEFARLTGAEVPGNDERRLERCVDAARRFGQVVVLKGARTVVAAPDGRSAVSPFAVAALATAGSGDVLAGLIGALIGQGMAPFDAACLGVYLHGRAGERLSWRLGDAGIMASDIAHELPATRHELAQHSQ